jgi:hypothetical protein
LAEANKTGRSIDPSITPSVTVFSDTLDLPITYDNVNPTENKLVKRVIGPHKILQICRNTVELDLPTDMTIYDTHNVRSLKADR